MTTLAHSLATVLRGAQAAVSGSQGVLGAACLATGFLLVAGLGWALVVLGVLFLVGAWSSR